MLDMVSARHLASNRDVLWLDVVEDDQAFVNAEVYCVLTGDHHVGHINIKWDGCMNINMQALHVCSHEELQMFWAAMNAAVCAIARHKINSGEFEDVRWSHDEWGPLPMLEDEKCFLVEVSGE